LLFDNNTFNWCFIGLGNVARKVALELNVIKGRSHKIVSVYSDNPSEANSFSMFYGGKVYSDMDQAISDPDVEAVYISDVSITRHYEIALKCIELKKPVLIEKPIFINEKQALDIFARAKENGVYVSSTTWNWFYPIYSKVKEWIGDGEIGDVKKMDIHFSKRNNDASLMTLESGSGALIELCTFPFSYCNNVFGYPDSIICDAKKTESGVDETSKITLKYAQGFDCIITVSLKHFVGRDNATITGTDGMITVPFFQQLVRAKLMSTRKRDTSNFVKTNFSTFDIVAQEIKDGLVESEFLPQENIIKVLRMIDECRRQTGIVYPGD